MFNSIEFERTTSLILFINFIGDRLRMASMASIHWWLMLVVFVGIGGLTRTHWKIFQQDCPVNQRLDSDSLLATLMWMSRLGGACFTTLLKLNKILTLSLSLSSSMEVRFLLFLLLQTMMFHSELLHYILLAPGRQAAIGCLVFVIDYLLLQCPVIFLMGQSSVSTRPSDFRTKNERSNFQPDCSLLQLSLIGYRRAYQRYKPRKVLLPRQQGKG